MVNRPEELRKHRSGKAKAVFLDRDGVLNQRAPKHEYIRSVSQFRILSGVPEAISRLTSAGLLVLVVTNQRGIARDLISKDEIERMHEVLRGAIERANGRIEKVYICPHDRKDECNCRKPSPGMLVRAQCEYDIDLPNSWMVGDSESDAEAGKRAGCHTILIASETASLRPGSQADFCVASLSDAVDRILSSL